MIPRDFLRCGGQARTVSPVDVTAVRGSQLTYYVEVAAGLLADFHPPLLGWSSSTTVTITTVLNYWCFITGRGLRIREELIARHIPERFEPIRSIPQKPFLLRSSRFMKLNHLHPIILRGRRIRQIRSAIHIAKKPAPIRPWQNIPKLLSSASICVLNDRGHVVQSSL